MAKADTLKKLHLYNKNPDLVQPLTPNELAELVVLVLNQVNVIEQSIQSKKLDLDTKFSAQTEAALRAVTRDNQNLLSQVTREVNALLERGDAVLSEKSSALEQRVQEAIERIRDGRDGIVSEAEIARAAQIAATLIELPDFDGMMTEAIQGNGAVIRDALESLPEGQEQLAQEAIRDLPGALRRLNERIDTLAVGSGGGIGRRQVYDFIRQAVADGTIPAGGGGSVSDEAYGGSWDGVTDEAPSKNAVFDKIESLVLGSGTGDVVGPASAVDSNIAAFDTTTGKLIKDGGATIAQVRDRATHTGTQAISTITNLQTTLDGKAASSHTHTASEITDFDAEVSNNTDVAANTTARHSAVTLAGTPNYITLAGQVITRALIDLTTHVTGRLPFANLSTLSAHQVLGRAGAGTGDAAGITMGNDTILGRSGSGDIDALSATQVRSIINVENGAAADQIASEVPFTPAGNISASDVQAAIEELDTEKQPLDADLTAIAALADPNADRILFWDDSLGAYTYLTASTGLTISGTSMTVRTSSSTQTGIVELATDAETTTGTDTTRAITPANLTSQIGTRIANQTHTHAISDVTGLQTALDAKAPLASPTFTGTTTSDLFVYDAARGKVTAGGNLGATETINFNDETNYTGTLDSNITFTFANATSGDEVTLFLSYDGTAQRTITWPTVTWLDNATGAAPATPAASGNVLVVTVRYIGTVYYASATGNYSVYA